MKNILLLTASLIFSFTISNAAYAQDDDNEACNEPGKKVMKLIKEAENQKNEKLERVKAYTDALELAPENAYVYFSFANFNYENALAVHDNFDEGRVNFQQLSNAYEGAAKAYKKTLEYCPNYHSDVHYKLGVIYYTLGDKGQAAKYFKSFVDFSDKDPNKYGENYRQNKKDVEAILPEMKFFNDFFNNPVPYEAVKLKYVSTAEKDEFLPMISPDNELLFFTRRGKDTDKGILTNVIEQFTMSQRPSAFGDFNSGLPLRSPFNTPKYQNYGGVSLSLDNKEMFICACQEVDYQQHANCDIYVTRFTRTGKGGNDFMWTNLENLGPAVNTKDGWEAQPTLSADGNTLYFATWREGSELTDIYYSTRDKDGKWTQAKPVPGPINSPGHDKAPFIHQDSETMYFVSDCNEDRLGGGGSDIFYTRKDENGNWTTPLNVGYPINTQHNEVGLIVSTDGKLGYFASGAIDGSIEIYQFELYDDIRPKDVLFVKGELKDDKGEPVKDAIVEVSYKNSGKNEEIRVNGDDGKWAAVVKLEEEKEDVMITMKKEGYSFDTQLIKAEELEKSEERYASGVKFEIEEIKVGETFEMDNILYATKSYALNEDGKFVLDQFVKFLKAHPTIKCSIQGHTDDQGDAKENQVLSENRAKGVVEYIVSKGIDKSRLQYEGFGEAKPKVPNNSNYNRSLNRRTEVKIISM
ncbi:OmpA family protein [Paracrocinitomix mangrovi]|uniref:OmpA family protein n=1 Tax=Paracrocinitomix mangrovi TaxID=2862509 RepID=UPI001C8DF24F|nr:OmpA family protein [Paracrocinitomix mangrovi]UKN02658.1 OmpA family protein [Paracrocinitomix mangrovi]